MYTKYLLPLILLAFIIVGCSHKEEIGMNQKKDMPKVEYNEANGKKGYVIDKGEKTGFLFAPTWKVELLKKYELNLFRYPDIIEVSTSKIDFDMSKVEVGQKIVIWFDQIMESYPPRVDALKVKILE